MAFYLCGFGNPLYRRLVVNLTAGVRSFRRVRASLREAGFYVHVGWICKHWPADGGQSLNGFSLRGSDLAVSANHRILAHFTEHVERL